MNPVGESIYECRMLEHPITASVTVPGSKSMTNRALFMAAMAQGESVLEGVLFSDDSRHFLQSLQSMGFDVRIEEKEARVTLTGLGGQIPQENPQIDVGSAGTAARFLTAMLALGNRKAVINCSEQMKARPMLPLFAALTELGARFEYLEEEGHLPVLVTGRKYALNQVAISETAISETVIQAPGEIDLDISRSTQFLSALLMSAPLLQEGLRIRITSEKKTGSYIRITQKMMEQFGCTVVFDGADYIIGTGVAYRAGHYDIEPDVSAAAYFYALAALTGSSVQVKGVMPDSMQGDMKFIGLLEQLGCTVREESDGIRVTGKENLKYPGLTIDMNDYSDQTMTMAAIAPFCTGITRICNVGHIRGQESDRMQAIVNELTRMQVPCHIEGDDLVIEPHMPQPALVETYEDHRMAMAFALVGLRAPGIRIHDPECCRKTFENYFQVLDQLYERDM